jgi:hypothetical protein
MLHDHAVSVRAVGYTIIFTHVPIQLQFDFYFPLLICLFHSAYSILTY